MSDEYRRQDHHRLCSCLGCRQYVAELAAMQAAGYPERAERVPCPPVQESAEAVEQNAAASPAPQQPAAPIPISLTGIPTARTGHWIVAHCTGCACPLLVEAAKYAGTDAYVCQRCAEKGGGVLYDRAVSTEECDRQDGGSIPVGSAKEGSTQRARGGEDATYEQHRIRRLSRDGGGECSCGWQWSAGAPWCPGIDPDSAPPLRTADSPLPLLPPYDRRYAGEHRTAAELGNPNPLDLRADDDVWWGLRMPAAADSRIEELMHKWFDAAHTSDSRLDPGWLYSSIALRRVLAIGLSAIDVLERRDTAFTREQAANAGKAVSLLAEIRASMSDLKPFWTPEAEEERAASWDGQKYTTYGSMTRDSGAASGSEQPTRGKCLNCGHAKRLDMSGVCEAINCGCYHLALRRDSPFYHSANAPISPASPQQTANCPVNAGGVCSEYCRPDPEGKSGFHMAPPRQWPEGSAAESTREKSRAFLRDFEFVRSDDGTPILPKARQLGMPTAHDSVRQYARECADRDEDTAKPPPPSFRMCYGGCGSIITPENEALRFNTFSFCWRCAPAAKAEYAAHVDRMYKAAGIQPDSDPNPTMFWMDAFGRPEFSFKVLGPEGLKPEDYGSAHSDVPQPSLDKAVSELRIAVDGLQQRVSGLESIYGKLNR